MSKIAKFQAGRMDKTVWERKVPEMKGGTSVSERIMFRGRERETVVERVGGWESEKEMMANRAGGGRERELSWLRNGRDEDGERRSKRMRRRGDSDRTQRAECVRRHEERGGREVGWFKWTAFKPEGLPAPIRVGSALSAGRRAACASRRRVRSTVAQRMRCAVLSESC